jgi:DNA-binding transcriptional LysR family regulator
MNIRNFDLNLLLVLNALFEERSVTRAAERLNLSQPAVSSSLNRLRDAFGDPLFVRTQRGVLPTPRAEELARMAKSVLFEVEQMVGDRPFDPASSHVTFTIGANDYGQFSVVAPLLHRLQKIAPHVKFQVKLLAEDIGEQLAKQEIDVAITLLSEPPEDSIAAPLFDEAFVGVTSADNKHFPKRLSLDGFCELPHVRVSPANTRLGDPVDEALATLGRTRNVVLTVPNFFMIPRMLRQSSFVSVVPQRLLTYFHWTLREVALPLKLHGFTMNLIWHRRTDASVRHRWLRDQMQQMAQSKSDLMSPR